LLARIFQAETCAHWIERLRAHGVPCTPVRTLEEVAADPQAGVRGMFPFAGPTPVTGAPVKLSSTPGSVRWRAPRLGEHTREVLQDLLGLDRAAVDRLAAAGVTKG